MSQRIVNSLPSVARVQFRQVYRVATDLCDFAIFHSHRIFLAKLAHFVLLDTARDLRVDAAKRTLNKRVYLVILEQVDVVREVATHIPHRRALIPTATTVSLRGRFRVHNGVCRIREH